MKRRAGGWIGMVLLMLAGPAAAQGLVIGPEGRPAPLVLAEHRVAADVEERVAVVEVRHRFVNTSAGTVEGTFLFPLPAEAQVSDFTMTVDGEVLGGEVLAAEEARRIYEDIVRRSLDPALLELAGHRTFRARVFPIPPGAERTITLRYDATLPQDGETVTFRYPLRGTLTHRGAAMPTPWPQPRPTPAPRPAPTHPAHEAPAPQSLLRVAIAAQAGVKNVYSPSHAIDVRRDGDRRAEAVYEASEVLDGRDFVLTYRLDAADLGATLLTHRPYADRDGYFLLLLDPPAAVDAARVPPRDVVFVLDTSGSMRGEKMEQARDALRYCLRTLGPRDRFGIVAFSTEAEVFRETLRPADARDDGRYFVDRLEAGGGTNIHEALQTAAAMLDGSDDGLIVFLTDGLPSIGATDEGAIRAAVEGAAGRRVRLFAFGVGYDVNTRLLDGLARDTGALADYISPEEAIDDRIAAFFDKIRFPVMTDLALDFGGAEAVAVVPGALPDLYRGQQLVVAGRYGRPGAATVTLRGTVEGAPATRRYRFEWPARERERDYVARLWATRRVGQLLEAIRLRGENAELKDEVVALAKEFGLVTPYTSYLVLEDDALANAPQRVRPREEARMLDQAAPAAEALTQTSGRGAVAVSKQIRQMQEAEAAAPPPTAGVARVGGRTLRQQSEGAWVDVGFDAAQHTPVRLRFASDAYFAFLRLYPEALPFARLGDAVTFFFEGRYVQVGQAEDGGLDAARLRALFGG